MKDSHHLRPLRIMGVLNVTPDSFSDGGQHATLEQALRKGRQMIAEGADIIDVGGESTRPGSAPVDAATERSRVVPVIAALRAESDVLLSVDTTKPEVAQAALQAGANIINDVSALRGGDALAQLAAAHGAGLVLMHSRGTPATMQSLCQYDDVVKTVNDELLQAARRAQNIGVPAGDIWLDPGIGFAKTAAQNLELLRRLPEMVALGFPVLVGPSRKSFIGALCGADVTQRLGGTAAAVAWSAVAGVAAIRVHDVAVMKQTAQVALAIARHPAEVTHAHA
ncbi:MAG: dihydropteroate synthase [Proteobacteria bacterium]|nr:dihydropteroate synthase [Pseudomonadota bacterium]